MKQIGLGLQQYVQDNDEMFPMVALKGYVTHSWRTDLYPYIKSKGLFRCHSRSDTDSLAPDGFPISYAANDSGLFGHAAGYQGNGAFAPPGAKPVSLAGCLDPVHLIAICEIDGNKSYDFDIDDAVRFAPGGRHLWAGHDGMFHVLLADGHVRQMKPQQSAAYVDEPAGPSQQSSLQNAYKAGDKKNIEDQPRVDKTARNLWYRDSSKPLSANGAAVLKKCVENE